jgi:hypothetical protein
MSEMSEDRLKELRWFAANLTRTALGNEPGRCLNEALDAIDALKAREETLEKQRDQLQAALQDVQAIVRTELLERWEEPGVSKYELGELAGSRIEDACCDALRAASEAGEKP